MVGADGRMRGEARAGAAALVFLTSLPLGRAVDVEPRDLGRAAPAFPLVGAMLGGIVGSTAALGADALGPALAAMLSVALSALLTGAIHFDALADSADALGGRSPEHALEIMRDPRIGAFGAAALVLVAGIEAAALAGLAAAGAVAAVVASFGLARSVAPAAARLAPDARRGAGLGGPLAAGGTVRAAAGVVVAVALATLLTGWDGLALAGCAAGCAALGTAVCRRRFGGLTGDGLGALILLTEAACLCVALAL
jgi:adenosylcobinamide-GDP ribazoletransferase